MSRIATLHMLRSAISDNLRSHGFIISWLYHTPHATAVYASQPLSPVATQHSLPSGRYSLLGPDFHRLDRTSFAWRTYSSTAQ